MPVPTSTSSWMSWGWKESRLFMSTFFPEHAGPFAKAASALAGKRVAVLGHVRPDGDCIGSQVAMTRILRQVFQVDAVAVNQHPVPRACSSFVGDTPFYLAEDVDLSRFDAAVSVDCADRSRFGSVVDAAFPEIALNVDHHISNSCYAEQNVVDATSSATGELLAGIFLDQGYPLDPVTAQALYVGIATDTGQFRFASTTFKTFEICCHLLEKGADAAQAAFELYEKESRAKLALLQRFLASFRYLCDNRVCIGVIRQPDWDATGALKEDTEGFVDYARAIDGVDIGILVEEKDGMVKGSFRSNHASFRVNELAKQFNGGGHACAAGFNPGVSVDDLMPQLEAALESHLTKLAGIE